MLTLTRENYHSNEANQVYMSNSQYKDFIECEAAAMAKIRGAYHCPPSDALSLGSYVHAWLEGPEAMDEFKQNTPELFKANGQLYAKYEIADKMIDTLRNDKLIQLCLQGEKEVILTATMFGVPWKVKMDVLNREKRRFVDLKTVKSIHEKSYTPKYGYTNFVQAYEYPRQMAIYSEVERIASGREEWLESLIVAVSKEDEPDKEVIMIPEEDLRMELEEIEKNMPRIIAIKHGIELPERCEKCKYCRKSKQLTKVVHYMDLVG